MTRPTTYAEAEALRRDTVERQAKSLTRHQVEGLQRVRDNGPTAWCDGRGRAGGAVSRMFDRLEVSGLVTPIPRSLTEHGRKVLVAALTAYRR